MPRWYRRCRCSGSSSRGRPTSGRGCSRCCIIINAVPVKNQVPSSDRRISVEVKGLKASVLDLFVNGHIRVVLKPIIPSLPLVGGVQVRVDFHKV